jgi:DNA repair protein RecN (Recombination protein N)
VLKSLTINNVVLIEKAEIEFASGLCILSGETGSGKSILLDALGLAAGSRSNLHLIGNCGEKAQVAAIFNIKNNAKCKEILAENELLNLEDENLLTIRRIISENSGKIFVNDTLISLNLLAKIAENLIEIHGQHDQSNLLNSRFHLEILDNFANHSQSLEKLGKIYKNLREVENKILEIKQQKEKLQREKEYLQHVISELENSNILENEEEILLQKKEQLIAKEKILKFLSEVKIYLNEANSNLISAQRSLMRGQNVINNFLPKEVENFEKLNEEIDKNNQSLDSAIDNFDAIISEISGNENNLEEIEERLFSLRSLARKHSCRIAELNLVIINSKEKLENIAQIEGNEIDLEKQQKQLFKQYQETASALSKSRQQAALILGKKVEDELKFLKMDSVKFLVSLEKNISEISALGFESCNFKAAINNNVFNNIAKIASGGELSRFMLALKVALLGVNLVPTIIFDEIDTGIGGAVANAVGNRLKKLGESLQVMVVTHQAQIAAKADLHFKVSKIKEKNTVKTLVEKLDSKSSKEEIARMLSGENVSEASIAAAKVLIEG